MKKCSRCGREATTIVSYPNNEWMPDELICDEHKAEMKVIAKDYGYTYRFKALKVRG